MLYLAIDLHSKQLTVSLRDEDGEVMTRRQVSTRGEEPRQFLEEVRRQAGESGYVAILEVCGFHDWLTELLPQVGCREVVLIQAEQQSRRKTDRRDAGQLGEILWINRARLLAGRKVQGVKRVVPPTPQERHDRRLTQSRRNNGAELTRVINGVKHILRRLNIGQHCPTKGIQTKAARKWLRTLALGELDRLEMNHLLARWELLEKQGAGLDEQIAQRALADPQATLLRTVPGIGFYMSLGFSSRIGNIQRFATPRSIGNYWGLTRMALELL
jgi:transposase